MKSMVQPKPSFAWKSAVSYNSHYSIVMLLAGIVASLPKTHMHEFGRHLQQMLMWSNTTGY